MNITPQNMHRVCIKLAYRQLRKGLITRQEFATAIRRLLPIYNLRRPE